MRTRAKKEGRIEEDEKAMKGREEKLKDGERETNANQPMHTSRLMPLYSLQQSPAGKRAGHRMSDGNIGVG